MEILRHIFLIILGSSFAALVGHNLFKGIKSGVIGYSNSKKTCSREKRPLFYWFLVIVFTGFTLLGILTVYFSLKDLFS